MKEFCRTVALAASLAAGAALWPPAEAPAGPGGPVRIYSPRDGGYVVSERVVRSPEQWRSILSAEQYRVLREKGTERAFSGALWDHHGKGVYACAGCGAALFDSDAKFDSGTGWPSFWRPLAAENVGTEEDHSLFMRRTEVHCTLCGGHLGHVFDDGPPPTGLRYCINSAALVFQER